VASLEQAIKLTQMGFHVFPLGAGTKLPIYRGSFKSYATREEKILRLWWIDPLLEVERDYNIGICTELFGDNGALVVVDIDRKKTSDGLNTFKSLQNRS